MARWLYMDALDALLLEPTVLALVSASLLMGLGEGLKPGPLSTLVISETLQHDWKAGSKVAMSPLITDAPIITISALLWSKATSISGMASILYVAGGLFLLWLGFDGFRNTSTNIDDFEKTDVDHSLRRGVITNLLNPNPWMFWTLAGAPFLVSAWNQSVTLPFAFLIPFFSALIGVKVGTAYMLDKSKSWMNQSGLMWSIRVSSLALIGIAGVFIYQGTSYL